MTEETSTTRKQTDFAELLPELHGGVLLQKLNRALSEVTLGVCYSEAKKPEGEVILRMKLTPIGDSSQVAMEHKLSFTCPTPRGKKSEHDTTNTPLHAGKGGRLTAYPERQEDFFTTRDTTSTKE